MKKQITEEDILREIEQQQQDAMEDQSEDNNLNNMEFQEGYPAPTSPESQNSASFIHKAAFDSEDTVKTTFLSESELGRPLFNVRFILDMEDISMYHLDEFTKQLQVENRIASYFREKLRNITDSGMSNRGFSMNLNVTRKMDTTRRRENNIDNLKGGSKKI